MLMGRAIGMRETPQRNPRHAISAGPVPPPSVRAPALRPAARRP
jgi:hypothetical protein